MTPPGPGADRAAPPSTADKAAWRAWARTERARLDMTAISRGIRSGLEAWGGLAAGSRVLLFDPLPDEPDVTAVAAGVVALLTRTPESGPLTVHPFDAPRERHRLGFTQPAAGSPEVDPAEIDVALVPGLAFDRSGIRLGRGGGHYDRLLARLRPDAVIVGVTPAALVVDRLPREAHDRPVGHLAVEDGVVSVPQMSIFDSAAAWVAADPDPVTRAELQALIDAGDEASVRARMIPLDFGTAGIRGEVGAGPGRMNRAVVIRTTRGLADHLVGRGDAGRGVVVGYDGRTDSRRFAEDAVAVLAGAGFAVRWFSGTTPTPLVAHALLRSGAAAAVVITASHNPPQDNGYKVYDANGAQIIPPIDADIAAAILTVGPASAVPRGDAPSAEDPSSIEEAYVDDVMSFRGTTPAPATVPIVYTALHGVGGRLARRLLAAAGHHDVNPVPEQQEPDGAFPTVAFPNPEEPGALDRAEALATRLGADLVVANDPDADRLGVAVPDGGAWRRLTGNEIGVLLADFVLERTSGPDRLVITSVVSTPMLEAVAAHHRVAHATTLTGFKWICNAALDLEARGRRFVFGFEEALGYTVGPVVRDKDGMAAAVWFADLAAACAVAGETVLDRLARLWVRDGLWVSHPVSIRLPGESGPAEIDAAMERLVTRPPGEVGGVAVVAMTDYAIGASERPRWLAATPLIELTLAEGSRVLVRPSGTEPKLKIYIDIRADVASVGAVPAGRGAALQTAERIAADLLRHLEMS
ncbi:MAG: 5-formyltetrahydrofolate cyclo-ligase [Acidimicrobiia bacterium]|nr:5-formyltetrahydrofolate cyclo-ligase [Acidimicrobiia bacterium]